LWTEFKDRRVNFSRVDVGDADAALLFLGGQAQAKSGHAEFGSRVCDPAERTGPLARHTVDIDDDPVLARQHPRQGGVDAIESAVEVRANQLLPGSRRQFAKGTLLDVDPRAVDEDIDGGP